MTVEFDQDALESAYRDRLEPDIIAALAARTGLAPRQAMDVYYRSRLAREVGHGEFGLQYLSAEVLADDLIENEPDLVGHDISISPGPESAEINPVGPGVVTRGSASH